MENPKEKLKDSIHAELENAEFPIEDQIQALDALPDGMKTEFEFGEESISIMEFATEVSLDFPYESVEELADDAVEKMEDMNFFDGAD